MANGEYADMSTTDKLAQALRNFLSACPDANDGHGDNIDLVEACRKARKALAEYDATPAGGVTADAVEVALVEFCKAWDAAWHLSGDFRGKIRHCLAAAFPVLVQQVERLTENLRVVNEQKVHENKKWSEHCETLSADNARLAKDAERYGTLRSTNIKRAQYSTFFQWAAGNPPYLELKHGADLDAAVDAATAQAKQAEGG